LFKKTSGITICKVPHDSCVTKAERIDAQAAGFFLKPLWCAGMLFYNLCKTNHKDHISALMMAMSTDHLEQPKGYGTHNSEHKSSSSYCEFIKRHLQSNVNGFFFYSGLTS
jgi:hypothetical protein